MIPSSSDESATIGREREAAHPRGTGIAVVGAGLGGLVCANYLARGGRSVTLFEKAQAPGGRARTQETKGFRFNQGAHALYNTGAAARVLSDLGIRYSGGGPTASDLRILADGQLHPTPATFRKMLSTKIIDRRSKARALRVFTRMRKFNPAQFERETWREWLDREAGAFDLSALIEMTFRLVTYANDPTLASACPAVEYFQKSSDGVTYLDGGWQVLIDGLQSEARRLGVELRTGSPVEGVDYDGHVKAVRLKDGTQLGFKSAVLAVDPAVAISLLGGEQSDAVSPRMTGLRPVRSASWQVGLSRLPNPACPYVLGMDKPVYCSAHSNWASLAPSGGVVLHLEKYLGTATPSRPDKDREELEALLELAQPGWQDCQVAQRFLPEMVTCSSLAEASRGGLTGRPSIQSEAVEGLYFVGDWVGTEGNLCDASMASAALTAKTILRSER